MLVTSGATPPPFYPDAPTFAEQDVKDIAVTEWFGLFAPSATPPAVVARAADMIGKIVGTKEIAEAFDAPSMAPKLVEELYRRAILECVDHKMPTAKISRNTTSTWSTIPTTYAHPPAQLCDGYMSANPVVLSKFVT